jgi:4-carboxymuconolactone decarboxylase
VSDLGSEPTSGMSDLGSEPTSGMSEGAEKFADLPETRRRGLLKMEQVYGFDMTDGEGDFFGYTADHLFADVWERPGLSDRDRRLLLIGLLAGQGAADVLGIQIPAAYANGELDDDAMREIVIFLCHYAGWPNGARINSIVEETIARARRQRKH